MASIARRPDGTYRPRYRDEHGKEHARHFKRKVDAQRWLDEVTAAVQTGTYVDPTRAKLTVGELAHVWLAGKVNLKPTSRARYADVLKTHVLPRWGNVALIRVTHGDVQAWLSELSDRGLAGASVRKAQGVLSGILGLAVRDRRLAVNPALGVALPPMQEKRRRYLTAERSRHSPTPPGPAGSPSWCSATAGCAGRSWRRCGCGTSTCCADGSSSRRPSPRSTAPAWCGAPPRPTAAARCRCRGSSSTNSPGRW